MFLWQVSNMTRMVTIYGVTITRSQPIFGTLVIPQERLFTFSALWPFPLLGTNFSFHFLRRRTTNFSSRFASLLRKSLKSIFLKFRNLIVFSEIGNIIIYFSHIFVKFFSNRWHFSKIVEVDFQNFICMEKYFCRVKLPPPNAHQSPSISIPIV